MDYDISIIKTENEIKFDEQSRPIVLLDSDYELPFNKEADVAGWGLVAVKFCIFFSSLKFNLEFFGLFKQDGPLADILQTVSLTVWNQSDCLVSYGSKITDRMFCAGDNLGRYDSCGGDSGGPLVYNKIQIGIVSWGTVCGKAKYPGVYTDVRKFLPWIKEHLRAIK